MIEGVLKEKGIGGCGEKKKSVNAWKKKIYSFFFLKNFKLSNLTSVVLACGCPMCLLVGGVAVSMGRCHLIGCYHIGVVVVG